MRIIAVDCKLSFSPLTRFLIYVGNASETLGFEISREEMSRHGVSGILFFHVVISNVVILSIIISDNATLKARVKRDFRNLLARTVARNRRVEPAVIFVA